MKAADDYATINRRAREIAVYRAMTPDDRLLNRYGKPCLANPSGVHEFPNGEEYSPTERWSCMHCGAWFKDLEADCSLPQPEAVLATRAEHQSHPHAAASG